MGPRVQGDTALLPALASPLNLSTGAGRIPGVVPGVGGLVPGIGGGLVPGVGAGLVPGVGGALVPGIGGNLCFN